MLLGLLGCFLPVILVLSVLFARSLWLQQQATAEQLRYTAQDISTELDRFADGMYIVSDAFSTDERLLEMLDRDYTGRVIEKRYATAYVSGAIFEGYARLVEQEKIGAIYNVNRRDVLDFQDPNQSTKKLVDWFEELELNDPSRLGRFYTYPLGPNLLRTEQYGQPRRDHVVLGSRRVYSALKSGYPYIHVFAVEEQKLYDLYRLEAERAGARVYVLDQQGGLISSTDEQAVVDCAAPAPVLEAWQAARQGSEEIWLEGSRCSLALAQGESTSWDTLLLVPTRQLDTAAARLYLQTILVLLMGLGAFAVLLTVVYRRFMAPLAQLEQAMHRADLGDLRAYVHPQGPAEVVRMMEGYNAMLDSLRIGMEREMQLQRRRQELEMQVLMSQINPHFLYNTLETIVWKAGEAGRPDIGKLASSLGKLYRLSISGGLFVPLRQELDHVQMYMNIQRSRYGNKVSYDVRLKHCDAAAVEVLKLILQPVVENSLLYGMDGLDRVLRIRITARRRGDKLVLWVTDNGVGMDADTLEKVRSQIRHGRDPAAQKNRRSTGIGLHNIEARLRLYAGKGCHLTLCSRRSFGTRAQLELPWRSVDAPPAEQN